MGYKKRAMSESAPKRRIILRFEYCLIGGIIGWILAVGVLMYLVIQ